MAIKTTWVKSLAGYDTKAEKQNAYVRISTVQASKESALASVIVYASEPSNDVPAQIIDEASYGFTPSVSDGSANFIKQAYEHLKTLPEFSDAIDC